MSCNLEEKEKEEKKFFKTPPFHPTSRLCMKSSVTGTAGSVSQRWEEGEGKFSSPTCTLTSSTVHDLPYPRSFPEWGAREYQYDTRTVMYVLVP